jgi:hypothetical protein
MTRMILARFGHESISNDNGGRDGKGKGDHNVWDGGSVKRDASRVRRLVAFALFFGEADPQRT